MNKSLYIKLTSAIDNLKTTDDFKKMSKILKSLPDDDPQTRDLRHSAAPVFLKFLSKIKNESKKDID